MKEKSSDDISAKALKNLNKAGISKVELLENSIKISSMFISRKGGGEDELSQTIEGDEPWETIKNHFSLPEIERFPEITKESTSIGMSNSHVEITIPHTSRAFSKISGDNSLEKADFIQTLKGELNENNNLLNDDLLDKSLGMKAQNLDSDSLHEKYENLKNSLIEAHNSGNPQNNFFELLFSIKNLIETLLDLKEYNTNLSFDGSHCKDKFKESLLQEAKKLDGQMFTGFDRIKMAALSFIGGFIDLLKSMTSSQDKDQQYTKPCAFFKPDPVKESISEFSASWKKQP